MGVLTCGGALGVTPSGRARTGPNETRTETGVADCLAINCLVAPLWADLPMQAQHGHARQGLRVGAELAAEEFLFLGIDLILGFEPGSRI